MKQQIYQLIQEDIIKKIKSGALHPGDKLPTESEFSELYGTSKSSVKKALNQLVSKGYLYAIQRIGYYVSIPKYNNYMIAFNPFELIYQGEKITTIGIEPLTGNSWSFPPSPSDPSATKILFLPQLIVVGKIPAGFLLYKIFSQKNLEPTSNRPSSSFSAPDKIEGFLKSFTYHQKLKVYGETPPPIVAEFLKLPTDTAVFTVEKSFFDQYEKPIGTLLIYYRQEYMQLNGISAQTYPTDF
nr:GntR family transcriptional regulator [uncultured Acetobacterium sp.]